MPSARAVNLTMNRDAIRDREIELGIKTAQYKYAHNLDELDKAIKTVGLPCIVKPVMSSSGKGQTLIKTQEEVPLAWENATKNMRGDRVKVIGEEFINFIEGSTLVIHNAPFDLGFLNNELQLASTNYPSIEEICEVEDSLIIARDKFPGQRNSLDALASRYNVSGYDRTFHGALLDANILADVYMQLTGGQSKFEFISNGNSLSDQNKDSENLTIEQIDGLPSISASKSDLKEHEKRISEIEKKYSNKTIWRNF